MCAQASCRSWHGLREALSLEECSAFTQGPEGPGRRCEGSLAERRAARGVDGDLQWTHCSEDQLTIGGMDEP